MKRKYLHEPFAKKFWDWWNGADLGKLLIGAVLVLLVLLEVAGIAALITVIVVNLRPADDLPPEEPTEGVAWIMPESAEAAVWLSSVCEDEAETARMLDEYTEGDAPVPEWYRPEEPMSAEWFAAAEPEPGEFGFMAGGGESYRQVEEINNEADSGDFGEISREDEQVTEEPQMVVNAQQPDSVDYNAPEGIDPGGIDWNLCTTVWGWDGHGAEGWELDVMARVFYIEFWGASPECCEAGCDAILNLWASGNYGRTLFEALSYYDPVYGYTYEVYPWIWDWNYDADGLAWCKDFCTERFINGPEWSAVYFQLGGYHDPDWVTPAYEIDGVYFSIGKGW